VRESITRNILPVIEANNGALPESNNLNNCQFCKGSPSAIPLLFEAAKVFRHLKDRLYSAA
jgi:hypothetical protein